MLVRWRRRWGEQAVWVRWVLVVYLVGFADGTGAHARDLAQAGLQAWAFAPVPARVFFQALLVLDPLVFGLVLWVRAIGVWLAAGVMSADMAANWVVRWAAAPEFRARFLPATGLLPITVFGLFVLITFVPVGRSLAWAGRGACSAPGGEGRGD